MLDTARSYLKLFTPFLLAYYDWDATKSTKLLGGRNMKYS